MPAMTESQVDRLEEAKNLLSRSRFGAKAVVALGLAPVHVRLAAASEAGGALVLSEDDPLPLLAVRLGAIGMRLHFATLPENEVRAKAMQIAEDLAQRLGGEDERMLRATFMRADFPLELPRIAARAKAKKRRVLAKAQRTKWEKKGWVWLGTIEVGDEIVLGDEAALSSERRAVVLPARGGEWFVFAAQPMEGKKPNPDGVIAAVAGCLADEVEGFEELLGGAKPAGEISVEGATVGLVDGAWRDRGALEKWTEEVEAPYGQRWGARVGERGCTSLSGVGDGVFPVTAFTGRDGKALLIRVQF